MTLKVAKKGRNAGGQFWSCSKYPACKGTRQYGEDGEPQSESLGDSKLPQMLGAMPAIEGWEVAFVQCVGLPAPVLQAVHPDYRDRGWMRRLTQWRLDYRAEVSVPSRAQWIAVVENLLLRGRLTLASPQVELLLTEAFALGTLEPRALARKLSYNVASITVPFEQFGSDEEAALFAALQTELPHAVLTPQANVKSLAEEGASDGRVDILVALDDTYLVVEIDGLQHRETEASDATRDSSLKDAGYQVIRLPAGEVRRDPTACARRVAAQCKQRAPESSVLDHMLSLCKEATQLQVAALAALSFGRDQTGPIALCIEPAPKEELRIRVLEAALQDFNQLIAAVAKLYGVNQPTFAFGSTAPDVALGFGHEPSVHGKLATLIVSDTSVPFNITFPALVPQPQNATALAAPDRSSVEQILYYVFRKPGFWEGQWEAIERSLQGKDTVLLLPTGAGKSIAFQMASLLRVGRGLVVDPIIALISDQIDNLQRIGIDRVGSVTGPMKETEKEKAMLLAAQGEFLLVYVAPERLQIVSFRDSLSELVQTYPVSLVAIDEAHCVSEWGHDFRTAYLNIARLIRERCAFRRTAPPILALSGTASRAVLRDVQRELEILQADSVITPASFDRTELEFSVHPCASEEKPAVLRGVISGIANKLGKSLSALFQPQGDSTACGLIFCPHIGGEYGIKWVEQFLQMSYGGSLGHYSGEPPSSEREDRGAQEAWKKEVQEYARGFKNNDVACLVCTKAYGMGIDKPNIRYTIHYNLPPSPEAFYQEAGRAGRNRERAVCAVICSLDHQKRAQKLLAPETSPEEIASTVKNLSKGENDDVTRLLYFHAKAFAGADEEHSYVQRLVDELAPLGSPRKCELPFLDEKHAREKTLHRLCTIGVVRDYSVHFSGEAFTAHLADATPDTIADSLTRYLSNYSRRLARRSRDQYYLELGGSTSVEKAAVVAASLVIRFIYDVIERGRRQQIQEMMDAVREAERDPERLRARLLEYFEVGGFEPYLAELLVSERADWMQAEEVLDKAVSPADASRLRAQAARELASYPTNPFLLFVRAIADCLCQDCNEVRAIGDLHAAMRYAKATYGIEQRSSAEMAARWSSQLLEDRAAVARSLITAAWHNCPQDERSGFREVFRASASPESLACLDIARTREFAGTVADLLKIVEELNGRRS